jgi:hypothetical protein
MKTMDPALMSWVRWTLLTEIGYFGGWYVAQAISGPLTKTIGVWLTILVLAAIWGAGLGAAQGLELARGRPRPGRTRWILLTSAGLILGQLAGAVLSRIFVKEADKAVLLGRALSALLMGAGVGLGVGILQGWALRPRGIKATGWAIVNALGMAFGCLAGSLWADARAGGIGTSEGILWFTLAAGFGLGAASGWSFRSIASEGQSPVEVVIARDMGTP